MRKILFNPRYENIDIMDFDYDRILIKADNIIQEISVKKDHNKDSMYRTYTAQELRKIDIVNSKLDYAMSDEEIEYMLTNGLGTSGSLKPDDVAVLAGYRVEKKIIPL